MMKVFIILGALNAMMAVGTGAFGAHGLEDKLSDKYMSIWEKATTYQMYHGFFLLYTSPSTRDPSRHLESPILV